MHAGDSGPLLQTLRRTAIPTIVLHGADDAIIPFENACAAAEDAGAVLYKVHNACHSWLIAQPHRGAGAVRQLLSGELGQILRAVADEVSIIDWQDVSAWEDAMLRADAPVTRMRNDDPIAQETSCEVVEMERVRPGGLEPDELAAGMTA